MTGSISLPLTRPRPTRASSAAIGHRDIRQGGCGYAAQIVRSWRRRREPLQGFPGASPRPRCDRMNSYGDSQSARARARVPGSAAASTPDDDRPSGDPDEGRPAPDAYRRGTSGRAGVGSASVGGDAGRASVGSVTGSARVGARPRRRPRPVAAARWVGGRAAVARAAVRPARPDDEPAARRRSGGGTGNVKDRSKAAKRRRRANILTAAAAVVVILLGAGVVGGTYFFDDVQLPDPKTEDQSNVIQYTTGATLAKIGDQNRTVVPQEKHQHVRRGSGDRGRGQELPRAPRHRHEGHRPRRVEQLHRRRDPGRLDDHPAVRAARGRLKDISFNRKLREAVIARKLEAQYSKDEILGLYLNSSTSARAGTASRRRRRATSASRSRRRRASRRDHAVRGRGPRLDHQAARAAQDGTGLRPELQPHRARTGGSTP